MSPFALLTATFLSTFLLLNLLTVTPAHCWYDKGHRIVGLIAQAHLTAGARKEIERSTSRQHDLGGRSRLAGP